MKSKYLLLILVLTLNCYAENTSFNPGKIWMDESGKPINAHSGQVIKVDSTYYWIGENRTGSRANTGKINEYSSKDLYNWKYERVILDLSGLSEKYSIERPKIIYNKKTGKYLMWFHLELGGKYRTAKAGVAESIAIDKPFKLLNYFWPNAGVVPLSTKYSLEGNNLKNNIQDSELKFKSNLHRGSQFRDMTAFVDDDDKAYIIYASDGNKSIHVAELNDEYTGFSGRYIRTLVGKMNEAPTIFKYHSKYYLITSGVNGFGPSQARLAVSDSMLGNWEYIGTPIEDADSRRIKTTFESQGAYILKIDENEKYIFMADRWNPKELNKSTYVWLPISLSDGKIKIKWVDSWQY